MKKWIFLLMTIFLLVNVCETSQASEANYQSNGEISFYGVYEKLPEPESEPPSKGSNSGMGTVKLPVTNGQKYFPQTGEKSYLNTLLIGLFTIVCATVLYNSNNKKQKNGGITQ